MFRSKLFFGCHFDCFYDWHELVSSWFFRNTPFMRHFNAFLYSFTLENRKKWHHHKIVHDLEINWKDLKTFSSPAPSPLFRLSVLLCYCMKMSFILFIFTAQFLCGVSSSVVLIIIFKVITYHPAIHNERRDDISLKTYLLWLSFEHSECRSLSTPTLFNFVSSHIQFYLYNIAFFCTIAFLYLYNGPVSISFRPDVRNFTKILVTRLNILARKVLLKFFNRHVYSLSLLVSHT